MEAPIVSKINAIGCVVHGAATRFIYYVHLSKMKIAK